MIIKTSRRRRRRRLSALANTLLVNRTIDLSRRHGLLCFGDRYISEVNPIKVNPGIVGKASARLAAFRYI
jgi:hypothetical protein